jgi:alpha,alpha-trehalase
MGIIEDYKDCLEYIDSFWDRVTVKPKNSDYLFNILKRKAKERMHKNILNVPNAFIVPNDKKFTHVFYWDTFFIFRGLIKTKREWLLKSMVDNFIYLYSKYGIIPNFNSPASTGRSQPPFLTSMILDTYNGPYFRYLRSSPLRKIFLSDIRLHKPWLKKAVEIAKREYNHVWMDPDGIFYHYVKGFGLNRYGDRDIGYGHSSELESGWDFTSRFYNRCDEFLPIDLNVFLYKYERDFAKFARFLGKKKEEEYWVNVSTKRRDKINKLMWDEKEGFFFDYGYKHKRRSEFLSLAAFTPLWSGMATEDQAKKTVKKLKLFETEYGLTITAKESLAPRVELSQIPDRFIPSLKEILEPKQWDYPNSWPPLEYLTVIGLLKYGYVSDAVRIMKKFLKTHSRLFRKHGTFFEKINGVTGEKASNFHYEAQSGFGWTNAAFYRYVQILRSIEYGEEIYTQPKAKNPPYRLSIPH